MKKIVSLLIMSISLFGCGQDAIEEFTPEEIKVIVSSTSDVIESTLSDAVSTNDFIDPNDILTPILAMEGVTSAEISPSGSVLRIQLEDGSFINKLLITRDDERWFMDSDVNETPLPNQSQLVSTKNTPDIILPTGSQKAIILAPFQKEFKSEIQAISLGLKLIGYEVKTFENEKASFDKFRGDSLRQYNIVIILSHGSGEMQRRLASGWTPVTEIITGTKWNKEILNSLCQKERETLFEAFQNNDSYFALNPLWLRATTTGSFKNTYVMISACQSSMIDSGVGSLSEAFLDLGVEGFNGFDDNINNFLAKLMELGMVTNFASGKAFDIASLHTRENNALISSTVRLLIKKENKKQANAELFDDIQRTANVPFYLVPPEGYQLLPSVSISSINNITGSTATCSCEVTYVSVYPVTTRGVCWSTSVNPTTSNSKTTDGEGLGPYTSNITGLSPNTTYYVRAYATNSLGTAYDEEQRTFTTNAEATTPSVTTGDVTDITTTTASCSGNVTSDGGAAIIASGVCWSTSENPTVANSKTTDGADLGPYTSHITGLSPNTTYYVRAYATNSQGTAYGVQRTFRTLTASDIEYGSFTDSRDGIVYKTVTIGEQVWMAENLAYLPSVVGPATESYTDPYYYVYGYDGTSVATAKATTNYTTYGVLYNWPAAMAGAASSDANPSNVKGICPSGWHLPSDAEWTQMENYLIANGYNYDGTTTGDKIAISLASANGWSSSPNTGAIGNDNAAYDAYRNKSGFTALPGGYRSHNGSFLGFGIGGLWWSSTQSTTNTAWDRRLDCNYSVVSRLGNSKEFGFSVRCVRD